MLWGTAMPSLIFLYYFNIMLAVLVSADKRNLPEMPPEILADEWCIMRNFQWNMWWLGLDFCPWCIALCLGENLPEVLYWLGPTAEVGCARPPSLEPAFKPNMPFIKEFFPGIPDRSLCESGCSQAYPHAMQQHLDRWININHEKAVKGVFSADPRKSFQLRNNKQLYVDYGQLLTEEMLKQRPTCNTKGGDGGSPPSKDPPPGKGKKIRASSKIVPFQRKEQGSRKEGERALTRVAFKDEVGLLGVVGKLGEKVVSQGPRLGAVGEAVSGVIGQAAGAVRSIWEFSKLGLN